MALYYDTVEIVGTANTEVVKALVTSTAEEPKHVNRVLVMESTATANNNALVRLYIEREKIAEVPIRAFTTGYGTVSYPKAAGEITVGVDLKVGETLYGAVVSGSTASSVQFVVEYEITG